MGGFCTAEKKEKKKKDCNWEAVMGRWREREQFTLLPSPFLCFVKPLFSLLRCLTSHKGGPISALGHTRVSPLAPPHSMVPYIYLLPLHSAECTMCCREEREAEKGKVWADFSVDLTNVHLTHSGHSRSHRPPSPSSLFLPFSLFLQSRAD